MPISKEELKILSYLSDRLGSADNILNATEGINAKYGQSYYPNIYNAIKKLQQKGILSISTNGKNKIIELNKENPLSTYYISEIENEKNISIKIPIEIIKKLLEMGNSFGIIVMCALETQAHLKIKRIELLIITNTNSSPIEILSTIIQLQSMHNFKIDPIILTSGEFIKMMTDDEESSIKDMILDKNILYNSNGFWTLINKHGIDSNYKKLGKSAYEINRTELAYNYTRFGYSLQEVIKPQEKISLENTIFSMSITEEARIKYGAIILLLKNINEINMPYLYYLYKRYDKLEMLKGMLISAIKFTKEKSNELQSFISIIPEKNTLYDNKLIKKYIELYS